MSLNSRSRRFLYAVAKISVFLLGISWLSDLSYGQSPSWITSISYQQNTTGDLTTMDIHVGLLQTNPCGAGSTLTVDPLPMKLSDVTSSQGSANPSPIDMTPISETGGYVYHLKVGTNLDLPAGWQTFSLSIPAHCTGSTQIEQSPAIIIRRFATNSPLLVSIPGAPQWNRSGNQDTISFVVKSNWPVSIDDFKIRDDSNNPNTHGNIVTEPYTKDDMLATTHTVTLKTSVPLVGGQQYKYDGQFSANGLAISPTQPLPPINLPPQPTKDFVLVQFPTPDDLTIKSITNDFTFKVQANDNGNVDAVFDFQNIGGSTTVHSTTAVDGLTHTFTISKNNIPSDGQYSFHFIGNRQTAPTSLADPHPSLLVVSTKTVLTGPIGIGLSSDSKSIVVTYCLSQATANEVRIFTEQDPSNGEPKASFAGDVGQPSNNTSSCEGGSKPYTATISLADFTAKLPAPTGEAAAPANAASAKPVPIQLRVLDVSGTARILASLNLSAVMLTNQTANDLINAVKTVINKTEPNDKKTAAAKTLTDTYKWDPATVTALTQLGKKDSGAAATIGTLLGVFGKSVATAYLGIPAAK